MKEPLDTLAGAFPFNWTVLAENEERRAREFDGLAAQYARNAADSRRRARICREYAQSSEAPPISPSNASAGKEAHDEP